VYYYCVTHRPCDYWFVNAHVILSRLMSMSRGGHSQVSMIFILIFTRTLIMILLAFVHDCVYSVTYVYEFES
jgi:hypothetical protein